MRSTNAPNTRTPFEDLLAHAQRGILVDDSGASEAVQRALMDVAATEAGVAREQAVANARSVFSLERAQLNT